MSAIGTRCQRILQDPPRASLPARTRIRTLPQKAVHFLWKQLVLKIKQIFYFMEIRSATIEWMGPDANTTGILGMGPLSRQPESHAQRRPVYARQLPVKGEMFIVGEILEPGEGKKDMEKITHDPTLCQHPAHQMKHRGNKADNLWWLCQACGQRWKRIPIQKYEPQSTEPITGYDLITYGKYSGHTYQYVWEVGKPFCQMTMNLAEVEQASYLHKRFAEYLAMKEQEEGYKLVDWEAPAGHLDMEL